MSEPEIKMPPKELIRKALDDGNTLYRKIADEEWSEATARTVNDILDSRERSIGLLRALNHICRTCYDLGQTEEAKLLLKTMSFISQMHCMAVLRQKIEKQRNQKANDNQR